MPKQTTQTKDKNISEDLKVPEEPKVELDGFNLEDFIVSPTVSNIAIKKVIVQVPVRRPDKQKFFKVLLGEQWQVTVPVLEIKEDNEYYLVKPEMLSYLITEVKYIRLHLAYYMNGNPFLLPVTLPDPQNPTKWNSWHKSMAEVVTLATKNWIRVISDKSINGYQTMVATGIFPEPTLPENMQLKDYVRIAFKDHVIDSLDHPVIKQLLGQQ